MVDEIPNEKKGKTHVKPHKRQNPKSEGTHTVSGHMRRVGKKIKNGAKKLVPGDEPRQVGGSGKKEHIDETEREAYEMGYERGKDAGKHMFELEGEMSEEELNEAMSMSMDGLVQSAEFANFISPDLREMAGYEDPMGVGSYQDAPGDEAQFVVEELHQKFREGYYEAFREGYEEAKRQRGGSGMISQERRADYRDSECYDGHVIGDDGKCQNCGIQLE